ncbi:MAG: hypothetical protein KDK66_05020 [Deltaproteobacteria bacterium]|nr:hypothetical protein [Deltaproteobacteria bacterium]
MVNRSFTLWIFIFLFLSLPLKAKVIELYPNQVSGSMSLLIQGFRLYRVKNQTELEPIPFQIDEKVDLEQGKRNWALYAFDGGKIPRPNGLWDGDEPLLFLEKDGGSIWQGSKPEASKFFWELDLKNGFYLYLSWSESPGPLSQKKYLDFDPKKDLVSTEIYEVGFDSKNALIQDRMLFKKAVMPKNILDRFKVRLNIAIRNFFDLSVNEDGLKSKRVGYQLGPIRLIREVRAWKNLSFIKLIPKTKIDYYYYPSWAEMPATVNNPLDGPSQLDPETSGVMGMDFRRMAAGSVFFSNVQEKPWILGKGRSENFLPQAKKALSWFSLSGLAGSMVLKIDNDPKLEALGVQLSLNILESLEAAPPENEKGQILIGFSMPFHKIPKGRYQIKLKQVFAKGFKPGEEESILNQAKLLKFEGSIRAL